MNTLRTVTLKIEAPVEIDDELLCRAVDWLMAQGKFDAQAFIEQNDDKHLLIANQAVALKPLPSEILQNIPNNLFTHKDAWREALTIAKQHANVHSETGVDDVSYWQHEINAFDRTQQRLEIFKPVTYRPMQKYLPETKTHCQCVNCDSIFEHIASSQMIVGHVCNSCEKADSFKVTLKAYLEYATNPLIELLPYRIWRCSSLNVTNM